MAFRTQKISQMTPKGSDLEATDLIEVSTIESGSYVTRSITGQELIDAIPAPTGFVPESRTLTINGVTQDLSADRTFTISTGITIGSTAIASGTVGRVLFQGTGNVVQQSSSLFWDNTNGTLETTTTADNLFGLRLKSTTGQLRVKPYLNPTYGVLMESKNIADSAYLPFTISGSRILLADGNVLINTTTDAGFRLDVNGTARVSGNLTLGAEVFGSANTYFNGPSANTGNLFVRFASVNISSATKIGTTVYADTSSTLILGKKGVSSAARGFLASDTNYQDFGFVNTSISSGNINAWTFGQRQDTYFGNALGSFQIVGAYYDNTGAGSMVGGGFRVPLICNPNGDIIISGADNSINGKVMIGTKTAGGSKLRVVGLPTSSAGLSAGDIWNDAGTLKIV